MASTNQIQARYITLEEWAQINFSKTPHLNTLRRWVRYGQIQPQPKKVGRSWQVKRDAQYVD